MVMESEQPYSNTANGLATGQSNGYKTGDGKIDRAKEMAHETLDKACDKVHPALDSAFSAAHSAIDGVAERAKNATETLHAGTEKAAELQQRLAESVRHYIQEKPLTAIGIAIGAGALLFSILRKD
jgi:ElaB/YqjD/DUF883 family membrane-anchored ribosome-binding protein